VEETHDDDHKKSHENEHKVSTSFDLWLSVVLLPGLEQKDAVHGEGSLIIHNHHLWQ
jgi:hypothetical protein